jgi:hypothetical protein
MIGGRVWHERVSKAERNGWNPKRNRNDLCIELEPSLNRVFSLAFLYARLPATYQRSDAEEA